MKGHCRRAVSGGGLQPTSTATAPQAQVYKFNLYIYFHTHIQYCASPHTVTSHRSHWQVVTSLAVGQPGRHGWKRALLKSQRWCAYAAHFSPVVCSPEYLIKRGPLEEHRHSWSTWSSLPFHQQLIGGDTHACWRDKITSRQNNEKCSVRSHRPVVEWKLVLRGGQTLAAG